MANTTTSTNMSLPIPVVGTDPGPEYATDTNSCLTIIDSHDHAPGSGVQITPSGLNINSDLTFNNNNLTNARSLRLYIQSAALALATDINCLYDVSGDLYFNDGLGNQVRITQSGGVAGSPGSISNLTSPASAAYVAGSTTFVWQSAASTPANLDAGSVILRKISASSNGITLAVPSSLASDYTITLPALPAQTNVLTINTSGTLASITYDQVASNMSATGANAIAVTMTATGANAVAATRTRTVSTTVSAGGVAVSSSSGSFSSSSVSPVNVTNLSVTITTSGRPVFVGLVGDPAITGGSNSSFLQVTVSSGTVAQGFYLIVRDSTTIAKYLLNSTGASASSLFSIVPVSVLNTVDPVAAGTYTYKVQVAASSGNTNVAYAKLVAYEL